MIAGFAERARSYQVGAVAVPERNLLIIRSVILARVLEQYGFTAKTKLQVPEIVCRGNEECVMCYLRGLFQTDGTVQRDDKNAYCTIRLASRPPALLEARPLHLPNLVRFLHITERAS